MLKISAEEKYDINFDRREQESVGLDHENPALMTELRALRKRKDELENHLTSLQDSRRHLMLQLEGLMKLLKVSTNFIIFLWR